MIPVNYTLDSMIKHVCSDWIWYRQPGCLHAAKIKPKFGLIVCHILLCTLLKND